MAGEVPAKVGPGSYEQPRFVATIVNQKLEKYNPLLQKTRSPRSSYTLDELSSAPQRMARSKAMTRATTPSIIH